MDPKNIFGNNNAGGTDNGTVSFEELENAFKTPTQRQSDYERPASPEPNNFPPNLTNPDGEDLAENEPTSEISPEKAQRTGERIARVIDAGIDFTLSNFVARNNETYRADEKDLRDIADCWGEISQEHGWSIGPEWSLVILYIMVYGPLVKQAVADRRMAEIEERQRQIEARMDAFEQQQPNQKPAADGTGTPIAAAFTHQPASE